MPIEKLQSETVVPEVFDNNSTNTSKASESEELPKASDLPKTKIRSKKSRNKSSQHGPKKFDNNKSHPVRTKKSRLLDKLLARSIQHERNAICQCITYIAKNNFFD